MTRTGAAAGHVARADANRAGAGGAVAQVVEIGPADSHPAWSFAPGVPLLAEAELNQHRPDVYLAILDPAGLVAARCSCWWSGVPALEGLKTGAIGHYAASGSEYGSMLLEHACRRLSAEGCSWVVGPMDGTTWRTYRLVTDRGTDPPFFLEPWTPAGWLEHWTRAGFAPVAGYTSAVAEDLSIVDPRVERAAARLNTAGVAIRPMDPAGADRDLRRIYTLVVESFARSFLFTPVTEAEFLEQYRHLLPLIRPELVLLAERPGNEQGLCGFLFAVPDVLQARRGAAIDSIVIKTVAVHPRSGAAGLGSVLVERAHQIARELGYRRAIHALMHERNVSRNISRRYGRTMRRYALMGRKVSSQRPTPNSQTEPLETAV